MSPSHPVEGSPQRFPAGSQQSWVRPPSASGVQQSKLQHQDWAHAGRARPSVHSARPDTSEILEEHPPAAPGADSAAGSWEIWGHGRGQGRHTDSWEEATY